MNKKIPPPSVIEISKWHKHYLTIRNPIMTWEQFKREATTQYYRYHYKLQQNK